MKNTMDYLTIALPKGKLFSLSADLLAKAGYTAEGLSDKSRKLVIANEEKKIRFIVSKTADVPTYVEYGAADIGVIGKHGMQMEYIKLNGSIELGPIVGLSESIVDIVETGTTLRENDLEEIAYILDATARLIVNRVSFKLKFDRINQLTEELRKILELEQQAKAGV